MRLYKHLKIDLKVIIFKKNLISYKVKSHITLEVLLAIRTVSNAKEKYAQMLRWAIIKRILKKMRIVMRWLIL